MQVATQILRSKAFNEVLNNRLLKTGLYTGLSGVGYQILRLIDDSLPSILKLE